MKCSTFQKQMVVHRDGALPPDLRAHVDSCAACRDAYARTERVRKLMTLKQYETPDASFESRSLAAIHQRVVELNVAKDSAEETGRDVFGLPAVFFRYAAATALVLLLAVNVVSVRTMPSLQSTLVEDRAPSLVPTALASATNPAAAQPMLLASNVGPAGVQYGPIPSALVGMEY